MAKPWFYEGFRRKITLGWLYNWFSKKQFKHVLEVGARDEKHSFVSHVNAVKYVATDIVAPNISKATICCVADVQKLPFPDKEFDLVICNQVLEHVEKPFTAARELSRIVMPEGYLFVGVPFLYPEHELPADYWRFTEHGLKKLFEKKFSVVKMFKSYDFGRAYTSVSLLLQKKK